MVLRKQQQTDPPKKVNPTGRRGHKADGSKEIRMAGLPGRKEEESMKGLKTGFVVIAAALITFGLSGMAFAFHSGGVAECVGCHHIHDAAGGALLANTDASSTCLSCHDSTSASSYHISTAESVLGPGIPPGNRTPGGDFAWLKKTYTYNVRGLVTEEGQTHGHNIVAADFNYVADTTNLTNPGGAGEVDSTTFGCTDCHDQHGKLRRLSDGTFAVTGEPIIASGSYHNSPDPGGGLAVGAYRLLRGAGSAAGPSGVTFPILGNGAFNAVAPSSYNRTEAVTPTRVAYGQNTSDWCATCHEEMHSPVSTKLTHPTNQPLGTTVAGIYNSYVGSGDATGTSATSFDSIVPFQTDNSNDYTVMKALATPTVTTGPASSDRVMCLSCHRAHATGWEFMTRWDNEIEMIVIDGQWPGIDLAGEASNPKWSKGRTNAERAKAYNDKPASSYATYQRVLCNKCHAKD